ASGPREGRYPRQAADPPASTEHQPASGCLGGGSTARALAESRGSSLDQRRDPCRSSPSSFVALGWHRTEGVLLACLGHPGGEFSRDDQVRPQQCPRGDLVGASGANAETAVLGRALLPGCEERKRLGRVSGARLACLASPHGLGDDGDAFYAGGEVAPQAECASAEVFGHRASIGSIPAKARRDPPRNRPPDESSAQGSAECD